MNELSRRIGKFSSPEALLKAYECLESEFTKRCQKLKDAEKENTDLKALAADKGRRIADAKEILSDENFLVENVLNNDVIVNRFIVNYLEGLESGVVPSVMTARGGSAVLTPPKVPKNLEEAKRLADVILNGG
ncbi:MAG: hypothetical protein FWE03_01440 [Firmicutes bacterium]|nr:hypothetical protein [Bacillota bacterium]